MITSQGTQRPETRILKGATLSYFLGRYYRCCAWVLPKNRDTPHFLLGSDTVVCQIARKIIFIQFRLLLFRFAYLFSVAL